MTKPMKKESHGAGTGRFTISLANQDGPSYEVDGDVPLLDTLEEQGVSLPYGCRYGGCVSCAAKLLGHDVGAIARTLGIAASMAAGIRAGFGTMTKPLPVGRSTNDLDTRQL